MAVKAAVETLVVVLTVTIGEIHAVNHVYVTFGAPEVIHSARSFVPTGISVQGGSVQRSPLLRLRLRLLLLLLLLLLAFLVVLVVLPALLLLVQLRGCRHPDLARLKHLFWWGGVLEVVVASTGLSCAIQFGLFLALFIVLLFPFLVILCALSILGMDEGRWVSGY